MILRLKRSLISCHSDRFWIAMKKCDGLQLIVNRRDWLGSPANIKGTNKDATEYLC